MSWSCAVRTRRRPAAMCQCSVLAIVAILIATSSAGSVEVDKTQEPETVCDRVDWDALMAREAEVEPTFTYSGALPYASEGAEVEGDAPGGTLRRIKSVFYGAMGRHEIVYRFATNDTYVATVIETFEPIGLDRDVMMLESETGRFVVQICKGAAHRQIGSGLAQMTGEDPVAAEALVVRSLEQLVETVIPPWLWRNLEQRKVLPEK